MSDIKESATKYLNENLFALGLNFNAINAETRKVYKAFKPPSLDEILDHQKSFNEIHPLLLEMLSSKNVAKKLFGAILAFEIYEAKAKETLQDLLSVKSFIKVQNQIGHGSLEVHVLHLAESFLETGNIRIGYLEKKQTSQNLHLSIHQELKKIGKEDIKTLTIPPFDEVWANRQNKDKTSKLITQIKHFAAGDNVISKKLYASFLLKELDSIESVKILETLLNEETAIPILVGDIVQEMPAKTIAENLLNNKPISSIENSNDEYMELNEKLINKLFGFFRR